MITNKIKKLNKRQIAAETELSYSTVMRYFNGKLGVSDVTAAKIQRYAGKTLALPTHSKKTGGSLKIAAAFPSYFGFFWDSASNGFIKRFNEYTSYLNIKQNIIRYACRDSENFTVIINMLERLGADGYIIMPKINKRIIGRLSEFAQHYPTVFICDTLPSIKSLGAVICDYETEMQNFADMISDFDRGSVKRILLIGLCFGSERNDMMLSMINNSLSRYPNVEIAGVEMCDVINHPRNLIPSLFARIISSYIGKINAVFVNDGVTDQLCEALDKIKRNEQINKSFVNNILVFGMDADLERMAQFHGRFRGIYSCQNISSQVKVGLDILIDSFYGKGELPKKHIVSFTYNEI